MVSTIQCGGAPSADATIPSGGGSGQFDPICTNGVPSTEKVSTANTEKCVSCNTGFEKNGELCRPFNFICTNGVESTGKAPGKGIEKCTSCNSYYALKSDKTCAEVTVTTLAGGNKGGGMPCTPPSSSCMDGIGTSAEFNNPAGIAVDSLDNIYVVDRQNNRIRKITPGRVVSSFAGTGMTADGMGGMIEGGGFMNGPGNVAQFRQPEGVAVDSDGFVYVADRFNNSIRKITSAGVVDTLTGTSLSEPFGVAVDSSGIVYVADTGNNHIHKITLDSSGMGTVSLFAGGGSPAQFNRPVSVAVDGSNNVYVADRDNYRIQKITPNGVVTTLAGGGSGSSDGVGTSAKFNKPYGVAVDSKGFVYVADLNNHRIRKITPDGVVTTLAGGGSGSSDGTGTSVQFNRPEDVAVDKLGNVYVADTGNDRIRKITIPQ